MTASTAMQRSAPHMPIIKAATQSNRNKTIIDLSRLTRNTTELTAFFEQNIHQEIYSTNNSK